MIANEALRHSRQTILTDIGQEGQKKLKAASVLLYDALAMRMRSVTLRKYPACAICGENSRWI